ncbi:MAG: molecular chaperone TorD family protein [Alphaproteobacteria bacterium]|nr:molecular chaperone TorD family protein [Alphaproteobacteria bacterium]MBL6954318.1 molecular chaperone TorD family protein [Alphaproteobacteria bacterium]
MSANGDHRDAVAEIEARRAALYALLGRLLALPPDPECLDKLQQLQGDDTPLGMALSDLALAANIEMNTLEDEYTKLFYGMGQGGEILPYASYYLTGSLHDHPLAELRRDMDRLGIACGNVNDEPEDHIAALLEMMHGLIVGNFGIGVTDLSEQTRFFEAHLATWAGDLFMDLEAAESAVFFVAVARLGRIFLEVEGSAFRMAA